MYINFDKDPDHDSLNNILKPKRQYSILIPQKNESRYVVFDSIHQGHFAGASNLLEDFKQEDLSEFQMTFHIPDTSDARRFYDSTLHAKYKAIDQLKSFMNEQKKPEKLNTMLNHFECICAHAKDSFLYFFQKKEDLQRYTGETRMLFYDQNFMDHLWNGDCNIEHPEVQKNLSDAEHLANLKETIKELGQLIHFYELFCSPDICSSNILRQYFTDTRETFHDRAAALEQIIRQKTAIKSAISNRFFNGPSATELSTINYVFDDRNKYMITPDFGYVVYGFQKGFNGLAPYLGFNINFTTIDKDIPLKVYPNKTLGHYVSVQIGWTLIKLEEENKRSDFFSGSSLLTGIGYKLTQGTKISMGGIWFYQDNPNPVISSKTLAVTPYIGISMHLDLRKLMNNITDITFK